MDALELVRLPRLMALSRGTANLVIGMIDGPVAANHPDLVPSNICASAGVSGVCHSPNSAACRHGTAVASVLTGRRGARVPGIAPDCTLYVRPILTEAESSVDVPHAAPSDLADAIVKCVHAGARVLNLSVTLDGDSLRANCELEESLRYCAQRGVLVVVASGNRGAMSGSALTRQQWVLPVVAYGLTGRPLANSDLGRSIGIRGLGAPGEGVGRLIEEDGVTPPRGSSVAVPFVTGTAALLWTLFPEAGAGEIRNALLASATAQRRTIVPALMDAWGAYLVLNRARTSRRHVS